jgi:hypothetical protein
MSELEHTNFSASLVIGLNPFLKGFLPSGSCRISRSAGGIEGAPVLEDEAALLPELEATVFSGTPSHSPSLSMKFRAHSMTHQLSSPSHHLSGGDRVFQTKEPSTQGTSTRAICWHPPFLVNRHNFRFSPHLSGIRTPPG